MIKSAITRADTQKGEFVFTLAMYLLWKTKK